MITFKSGLSKKEKVVVADILSEIVDLYQDFYVTKNNLRLYLRDNPDVLFDCLRKGDKIAFSEDGIAVVVGYSDNTDRKYVKFLVKEDKIAVDLMKVISWNIKGDIYLKIKKNNPLRKVLGECSPFRKRQNDCRGGHTS